MKQIPSDKYNIAWFTLAECVSRGEKVRAFSLYRLLAHSIEDHAFTNQLKGDLLLAFQDDQAIELYEDAAELYQQGNRLLEAIGVYEHLITLNPNKQQYLKNVIKLYKQLKINSKVIECLHQLLATAIAQNDITSAIEVIEQLDDVEDVTNTLQAHQQLVLMMLKQNDYPKDVIIRHAKKVIDGFIKLDNDSSLQQFLSSIEALNGDYYIELYEYLENVQQK